MYIKVVELVFRSNENPFMIVAVAHPAMINLEIAEKMTVLNRCRWDGQNTV